MDWLHTQECCAKGITFVLEPGTSSQRYTRHWCFTWADYNERIPVEAAHLRDMTGMGRKESDLTCIPLCKEAHDDLDGRAPFLFKGWSKQAKKDFHNLRSAEVRERYKAAKR